MSDSRKNFICKARKHIINDVNREWGKDSICFLCEIEARREQKIIENKVDFFERKI